jgi:hypothetical protein
MYTKNRTLSLFVLISLATVVMPVQSMETPKQIIIKLPSKLQVGAFFMGCAACGIGLATIAKQIVWSKKEDAFSDVSEFVHATLQEHGIAQDKIDAIKIKKNADWQADHGYMGVPNDDIWMMLYFKRWELPGWERKINLAKMIVLHEYGHIINNDRMRFGGACMIAPLVAYGLWEVPHRVISRRLSLPSAELVRTGAVCLILFELLSMYMKYREHKADMVVVQLCKDPDILQHAGEWHLEQHKESSLAQISNPYFQKWYANNVVFRELYYGWKHPMDDHPSNLTRGENFLRAAEELHSQRLEKATEFQKE